MTSHNLTTRFGCEQWPGACTDDADLVAVDRGIPTPPYRILIAANHWNLAVQAPGPGAAS